MIPQYRRPQQLIYQNLQRTPNPIVGRQNALVIGTQYLVSIADGRDLPEDSFLQSGTKLDYRFIGDDGEAQALDYSNHAVDLASVKLFGEGLMARVMNTGTYLNDLAPWGSDPRQIRTTTSSNVAGYSLLSGLSGRSVQVGDILRIEVDNSTTGSFSSADQTFERRVVGLLPRLSPTLVNGVGSGYSTAAAHASNFAVQASVDHTLVAATAGYSVVNVAAPSIARFAEIGGRFEGNRLGEEVTLTCITGGAKGTAVFRADYAAAGYSENIVSGNNGSYPGADNFSFSLAHYGASVVVELPATTAVVGEKIRLRIFPVFDAAAAPAFQATNHSNYTGTEDTTYIVEVVRGDDNNTGVLTNAVIRVYDVLGKEPVQVYTYPDFVSGPVPLGTRGLMFSYDANEIGYPDLVTGDRFIFNVTAPAAVPGQWDGVVLDGPAYDTGLFNPTNGKLRVSVYQEFSGEITHSNVASGDPFTADEDGVTYSAGLGVVAAGTFRQFRSGTGKIKVSYRAAVKPGPNEGPITIRSSTDIIATLGEITQANDLAYAADVALSAAQGAPIYVLRTAGDTVEAWTKALVKIQSTDIYYALAVISDNEDVKRLVASHVTAMSSPERQNFRRCYIGTDSPGEYVAWGTLTGGGYRRATLIGDVVTVHEDDRAASNFLTGARVGDKIQFVAGGQEFTITELSSTPYEVKVSNPGNVSISLATGFVLIKPDTPDNVIDYVANVSKSLNNRRVVNVWADQPTVFRDGKEQIVAMKFVAAEVAGLRSALLPQQGLTNTELTSITSAPAMFARFTPEQLDRAAANGVMVVTQEVEGGEVFIRHQLTTRTTDGILAWEDNPGVIVDTFSYQIKDRFSDVIGKKNSVPRVIQNLRDELKGLAIAATQAPINVLEEIGPMIVSFADEEGREGEVTVRRDGDMSDQLVTYTRLRIPVPINGITHYVDAEVSLAV